MSVKHTLAVSHLSSPFWFRRGKKLYNGSSWERPSFSQCFLSLSSLFLFSFFLNLSPSPFFLISRAPPHTPSISCIVNSSQKRDKVSARVPPASLSVLPAICYCLLAIMCVCLSLSRFLLCFFFSSASEKAKVN